MTFWGMLTATAGIFVMPASAQTGYGAQTGYSPSSALTTFNKKNDRASFHKAMSEVILPEDAVRSDLGKRVIANLMVERPVTDRNGEVKIQKVSRLNLWDLKNVYLTRHGRFIVANIYLDTRSPDPNSASIDNYLSNIHDVVSPYSVQGVLQDGLARTIFTDKRFATIDAIRVIRCDWITDQYGVKTEQVAWSILVMRSMMDKIQDWNYVKNNFTPFILDEMGSFGIINLFPMVKGNR